VARDVCKLFNLEADKVIQFVENRPFNDQRCFLDDEKLKSLGWAERTPWEEGLRKTIEWYVANSNYWGDVSWALLPHPRTLMMPGYGDSEEIKGILSQFNQIQTNNMVATTSEGAHAFKFLIYGRTGWIGGLLGKICKKQGIPYEYGKDRLENRSSLILDIQTVKSTHVFNIASVTGRPNVDWCELHKPDTIRANFVGTLTLADVSREYGLLLLNYATGCIFEYDAQHPEGSGVGFKEEDTPNFTGSFYSKTNAMVSWSLQ
jgi:UDP-glucose 4,6-dehydratase